MSRQRLSYVAPSANGKICCFCGLSEDNELEFGKFYEHDGIVTHYYCLLLSSNTEQKGTDTEGILGFLTADIQKELHRGKRLICSYCKRTGATLGCCNIKCKRIFHFPCGLRAGSLHQFFGEFRSYCISHRPKQRVEHSKEEINALGGALCYICYDAVNPNDIIETLWAPCCRKNALFHRKCVQQLAMSAGYFFKCPLCNNKKKFRKAMLEYGIFIPSQDASWELEPNAFQELLHRHNRCDAKTCICPKGRLHVSSNAKWELILCRLCGSQGIHMGCGQLKWINPVWECPECIAILSKSTETAVSIESKKTKITTNDVRKESDYENSDTDISVGSHSPLPIDSNSQSSSLSTFCVNLRPGPRSFKLQQVEKVVLGLQVNKKNDSNSEETSSSTTANSSKEENNVNNSSKEEGCSKMANNSFVSYPVQPAENVITIDSDDDIEIVSEKPKQNILTTNYGTKIEIHNLHESVGPCHVEGDVKVKSILPVSPPVPLMEPAIQNFHRSNPPTNNENEIFNSNISNSNITVQNLSIYSQSEITQHSVLKRSNESCDDSIMNIKITNVTSLPPEVFASVPEDSNISQNTRPIELNAKRKSNVNHIIDKNAIDSANIQVIEKSKKLRTNDPGPSSKSINYNINVSQAGQSVPFTVTELSQAVPTNADNRTENPANSEGNITGVKSALTENPQENVIFQYLKFASKSASYQNSNNLNTTSGTQSGKIQHTEIQQTSNGVVTNRDNLPNSSNVSDYYTALSSQNGSRVYVRVSHNSVVDQDRIVTQQAYVPKNSTNNLTNQKKSEKNDSICTLNQDISNNESMNRSNGHCIAASQSVLKNMLVNTITNNYVAMPSNHKGSSNDKNNVSEVASTVLQQNSPDRFSSGCDGDAGTDPAIESRDDSTSAVCRVAETTESATPHQTNAASNRKARKSFLSKISTFNWAISNARCSSGLSRARCDRPRMIPESMCLRDLKFRVCGSDTIQMILYDTFIVNIKMDSANKQNSGRDVQEKRLVLNRKSCPQDRDECSSIAESCNSFENRFSSVVDDPSEKLEGNSMQYNVGYDDIELKENDFDTNYDDIRETMEGIEEIVGNDTSIFKSDDKDLKYNLISRYETYVHDDVKENLDPIISTSIDNAFETIDVLDKQNKILPSNDYNHVDDHANGSLNDVILDSLNQSIYRTNEQSSEDKTISVESCSYNREGSSVECVHGSLRIIGEDSTIDQRNNFKSVSNHDRKCDLDIKHLDKNVNNSIFQESKDCNITTDSRVVVLKNEIRDVSFYSTNTLEDIGTNEFNNSMENVNVNKSMVECLSMNYPMDNAFKVPAICEGMASDVRNSLKTFVHTMFSDKVKPCTENKYKSVIKVNECIKVSIDLKRIQNLIDTKPELFSKCKNTAMSFKRDFQYKYEFDKKPLLVKSQSLDSLCYGSSNDKVASFSSCTSKSMQNLCSDIASIVDEMKCDLKVLRQTPPQSYGKYGENIGSINAQSNSKTNSILVKRNRKRKHRNSKGMSVR